jgi:hypothetical protein
MQAVIPPHPCDRKKSQGICASFCIKQPCHPDRSRFSGGGKDLLWFLARISNKGVPHSCALFAHGWDSKNSSLRPKIPHPILQKIMGKYATLKISRKARSPEPSLFAFRRILIKTPKTARICDSDQNRANPSRSKEKANINVRSIFHP